VKTFKIEGFGLFEGSGGSSDCTIGTIGTMEGGGMTFVIWMSFKLSLDFKRDFLESGGVMDKSTVFDKSTVWNRFHFSKFFPVLRFSVAEAWL